MLDFKDNVGLEYYVIDIDGDNSGDVFMVSTILLVLGLLSLPTYDPCTTLIARCIACLIHAIEIVQVDT